MLILNSIRVFVIVALFKMIPTTLKESEAQQIRTMNNVYKDMLIKIEIQCPRVVIAQICLETNYLTSKIYRENHNVCGMKYSKKSKYALGTKNGHAYYETTSHSLLDYRDWQKRRSNNKIFESDEEYLYFLDHLPGGMRYAEDPQYTNKLRNIIKQLENG